MNARPVSAQSAAVPIEPTITPFTVFDYGTKPVSISEVTASEKSDSQRLVISIRKNKNANPTPSTSNGFFGSVVEWIWGKPAQTSTLRNSTSNQSSFSGSSNASGTSTPSKPSSGLISRGVANVTKPSQSRSHMEDAIKKPVIFLTAPNSWYGRWISWMFGNYKEIADQLQEDLGKTIIDQNKYKEICKKGITVQAMKELYEGSSLNTSPSETSSQSDTIILIGTQEEQGDLAISTVTTVTSGSRVRSSSEGQLDNFSELYSSSGSATPVSRSRSGTADTIDPSILRSSSIETVDIDENNENWCKVGDTHTSWKTKLQEETMTLHLANQDEIERLDGEDSENNNTTGNDLIAKDPFAKIAAQEEKEVTGLYSGTIPSAYITMNPPPQTTAADTLLNQLNKSSTISNFTNITDVEIFLSAQIELAKKKANNSTSTPIPNNQTQQAYDTIINKLGDLGYKVEPKDGKLKIVDVNNQPLLPETKLT